jgi:hypothetical protein
MRLDQSPNSPIEKPDPDHAEGALAYLATAMAKIAARERFKGGDRASIR